MLRIQERRWLLAGVDALLVTGCMMAAYEWWHANVHPAQNNMAQMPWAWVLGACAFWLGCSWLAGAYDLPVADRFLRSARTTLTVEVFALVAALGAYSAFLKTYPRPALGLALVAVPLGVQCWRGVYSTALKRPVDRTRVLVLGDSESFGALTGSDSSDDYFTIAGFVSESETDHPAWLGPPQDLPDLVRRYAAHRVVVAGGQKLDAMLVDDLGRAIEQGMEIVDFHSAYEEMTGKVAVDFAAEQWLSVLPTRSQTSSLEELAMRLMDIAGAAAGLMLAALLTPLIALAIKVDSRGPILYRQERLGRAGRRFILWKFRSMSVDAEACGPCWASPSDSRATRVGRFLRTTHLDELPQLWNVLRGEMSLVGPRPERPEFTDSLSRDIPFYRLRLSVRPGLTGLKQIRVGYASTEAEHLEVLRHDLYYIKHRSVALNLLILARTLGSVVRRDGR